MTTSLTKPDVIGRALQEARTLGEVKDIHDKIEALYQYAKKSGQCLAVQNEYAAWRLRAVYKGGEILLGMERGKRGPQKINSHNDKQFLEAIARAGITAPTAYRWQSLPTAICYKQLEESIAERLSKEKELTIAAFLTLAKNIIRGQEIEKQHAAIMRGDAELPKGVFEVIIIDPPWPYGTESYDANGRRASNPYPEMSLDEIAAIQLPAADNCVLWLWTTHAFMRHSFPILDKWGFEEKAIVTWVKDRMGLGQWLRSQSEFCIMAVKGKPMIDLTNQTTVIHGPMREHSRKPDEFYAMVDSLCIGRKVDWFSREPREGYAQMGNELEKFHGLGRQTTG